MAMTIVAGDGETVDGLCKATDNRAFSVQVAFKLYVCCSFPFLPSSPPPLLSSSLPVTQCHTAITNLHTF